MSWESRQPVKRVVKQVTTVGAGGLIPPGQLQEMVYV